MKLLNKLLGRAGVVAGVGMLWVGEAAATKTTMPWEGNLESLQKALTGPTATAVGVIAMFGAGAMLIFGGELSEFTRRMLLLVFALSLIFGGSSAITYLFGASGALIGL